MSDQPIRGFEVALVPKAGMIGRLFGRVPRETAFVEVGKILEWTMREALSDGTFTEQEKAGLEATSKALGMSDVQTKRLYETAAVAAVQTAFTSATADRRYAKDEEAHVAALAKSLGVTIKHDESTAALVARFRLMAQIEDGDLPAVDVPILL